MDKAFTPEVYVCALIVQLVSPDLGHRSPLHHPQESWRPNADVGFWREPSQPG